MPVATGSGGVWRRGVLLTLLVLVAAVCAWRAVDLGRHGWRPSAPGEHRWLGWGTGNGWERAALAALPERPPGRSGAALTLRLEMPGAVRPNWLRAQAQYLWPGEPIAAVQVVAPGATPEPAATRRVVTVPVGAPRPGGAPTAATMVRTRPVRELGSLALTLLAALALGRLLLPRPPRRTAEGPVAAVLLGLSLLTPAVLLAALSLPGASPALVIPAVLVLAAVMLAARRHRRADRGSPTPPARPSRPWPVVVATAVLLLALALFAAKVYVAPLWSWDHHSIWGLKARVMAALGPHPGLLESPGLERSSVSYPMGLPALSWMAAFGQPPTAALFKGVHILCGLGVVLLVRGAIRRAGGGLLAADTLAALLAASPLLWDTELVGLADLPLALWATAGLVLVLTPERGRCHLLAAGVLLGYLPWVKGEGLTLAAFLLAAGALFQLVAGTREPRRRPLIATGLLLLPAAGWLVLLGLTQRTLGAHGAGFFSGNWQDRFLARLGDAGPILARLGRELASAPWLGGWLLFAALVMIHAFGWRRAPEAGRAARIVAAVVLAQLAVYCLVYLATYLDPMAHIESSFRRIAAGLWPLAAVAAGLLLAAPPEHSAPDASGPLG